jgi:NAD(P)-dependent dehydrogenase (short-subunit alcohol dehydrogenase family)
MATATDVANVIAFLLSEQSAFITGQALVVDGGISLRWPEHADVTSSTDSEPNNLGARDV